MQRWHHKLEILSKKFFIRVVLIAIPVAISAIYTNEKNRKLQNKYEVSESENILLQSKVRNLEIDNDKIRSNMVMLSLGEDNYPNPKWVKSVDFMMLKLNKAYEDLYLKPYGMRRADYIGRYDYDIWDEVTAETFRKNDELILRAETPITFYENIIMPDGQKKEVEVTKYPIYAGDIVIGIGGFIDIDYHKNK